MASCAEATTWPTSFEKGYPSPSHYGLSQVFREAGSCSVSLSACWCKLWINFLRVGMHPALRIFTSMPFFRHSISGTVWISPRTCLSNYSGPGGIQEQSQVTSESDFPKQDKASGLLGARFLIWHTKLFMIWLLLHFRLHLCHVSYAPNTLKYSNLHEPAIHFHNSLPLT